MNKIPLCYLMFNFCLLLFLPCNELLKKKINELKPSFLSIIGIKFFEKRNRKINSVIKSELL